MCTKPIFWLGFSFFFFLGYDIGRTFINRVFVIRSLIIRRGIEEVSRLNWIKNEGVKPPLQFLLWYGSKQKKGPPLFPAVVVVVKGEKVKVKKVKGLISSSEVLVRQARATITRLNHGYSKMRLVQEPALTNVGK